MKRPFQPQGFLPAPAEGPSNQGRVRVPPTRVWSKLCSAAAISLLYSRSAGPNCLHTPTLAFALTLALAPTLTHPHGHATTCIQRFVHSTKANLLCFSHHAGQSARHSQGKRVAVLLQPVNPGTAWRSCAPPPHQAGGPHSRDGESRRPQQQSAHPSPARPAP